MNQQEFQTALGEEIRRLREAKNFSREKLSGKIGIHRNTLERYELGADIPVMVFFRLCIALGTRVKDVLERILPDAEDRIREANGLKPR